MQQLFTEPIHVLIHVPLSEVTITFLVMQQTIERGHAHDYGSSSLCVKTY